MPRMTPSEAMVETLVANGVTDVFGIMGSAFMDAMDIFAPAGIRFIPVVHEQGAGHMADGFSRVSGRHGVCIAQNGPGITNFVTAIAAAYWAHSPVVVITPETGSMSQGLGGFQEAQQLPFFETITKYQAHVPNPARMAELTGRCFDRAMQENGPTQLNIPRDFFYGDINVEIPAPIRIERSAGGEQSLAEAAQILAAAKYPVIISGGGVVMGDAVDACKALAEYLGAPVVNSYLHNDSFPASHQLWCGPLGYQGSKAAMKLLSRADVVLALGTRLGPFGTLPQHGLDYWPKQAKVIQIDCDSKMLGLVKKITVGICGDAKAAAVNLLGRLENLDVQCLENKGARAEEIAKEKFDWESELNAWIHEKDEYSLDMIKEQSGEDGNYLHPRQVLRELEKAMPADAMVSTDIGNINSVSNSYLRFEKPRSFFAAMSFGNCGYALPTIIGAKVAAPHRTAISYAGDGAWGMSMMEIMTCVRENIPVTSIVFHNRQWGAEKKNQVDFYNRRFVAGELENQSFAGIARSMGAEGVTVDRLEDVGPALMAACEAQKAGKTTVIEIMCTRELGDPFRRDALSKPVRFLEKYKDYV
ncbi:MAG: sulfoacetaldehyde acetyltransferase [Pseudomonadales bacterium]|uniref:sulfoacetaldehyde acetyltransferase n=1 Tax=Pseudomonas sp. p50(2008) TaxID=2816832 RepID=UPI00188B105A|nr:sulfoacetaldehyde acetyltransferase [Pseudomonas sp. p50(2008)]MBF4554533.1 sulfoacetaldehyde acetyltransferase [Pseudomonas sp. p50(2008)]MBH1968364.1 sulfoacetaldehyde acetyltransferase [Pseudomonadales bacterium]MBH2033743.1 sulfoacetaldehyde acetyltransferase [Pseudomonadales bacterium]MBH2078513.1 sulfoacetaldehyde acetyltransferase [Pseudomonadales bacterium]